jgi:iron(III) transport system permease protein
MVRRRERAPRVLVAVSTVIAALVLLPLVFLIIQATHVGWEELSPLLLRRLTVTLLWNTLRLAVVVTVGCAVIGTGTAWCVERTRLPARRVWAVLLVIPLAIPDFVIAYAWSSAFPSLHGLWGAALVMTLGLYPLVYLPVAGALRRADPTLEEVARSLGKGRATTFRRVTLPQVRLALVGGCLLVTLVLLAEFGAFEILRYQTLTTTIFTEFSLGFNTPAACALSGVLVAVSLLVLGGEALASGPGRVSRAGAPTTRAVERVRLGVALVPTLAVLTVLVGLTLGVPIGTVVYWLVHGQSGAFPGVSVVSATWHTVSYAAAAAALATVLAVPIAVLSVRHRGKAVGALERSTFLVQAVPGLVIGLSLVYFSIHYAPRLYQKSSLLVLAYAILFFPLALVCVRASMAQADPGLEEAARSLGRGPLTVFRRVTLPLVAPGLAAGFCLVFLSVVTELTLTLVLVPTGVHTLATQFWAFESNASYGAAAPYAGLIIAIAVVPSYLLERFFERRTGGRSRIGPVKGDGVELSLAAAGAP